MLNAAVNEPLWANTRVDSSLQTHEPLAKSPTRSEKMDRNGMYVAPAARPVIVFVCSTSTTAPRNCTTGIRREGSKETLCQQHEDRLHSCSSAGSRSSLQSVFVHGINNETKHFDQTDRPKLDSGCRSQPPIGNITVRKNSLPRCKLLGFQIHSSGVTLPYNQLRNPAKAGCDAINEILGAGWCGC